jgi:hypothetical protein
MSCAVAASTPPLCKCGCGLPQKYDYRITGYHEYQRGHFNRKYTFDRSLFESIDTEEDAYWLGFFFADGWVKDRGSFGFMLSMRDYGHLISFRAYARSTHPIDCSDRFCRLEIAAKEYLPTLAKYGLVQGKSSTVVLPALAQPLRRHFVRGVFDGDGWYSCRADGFSRAFGIIGSDTLLTGLQEILIEECGMSRLPLYRDKNKASWVATLSYGGRHVCERLYHYLYDGATVYLPRKKDKWEASLVI